MDDFNFSTGSCSKHSAFGRKCRNWGFPLDGVCGRRAQLWRRDIRKRVAETRDHVIEVGQGKLRERGRSHFEELVDCRCRAEAQSWPCHAGLFSPGWLAFSARAGVLLSHLSSLSQKDRMKICMAPTPSTSHPSAR